MADAMDTLKNILGDDAEDKIKNVMSSFGNAENDDGTDYLIQMRDLIDQLGKSRSDPRANLLIALKPYMRETRQKSIDSAVKLLNLAKLSQLFKM
jgi:hypothetical protein